MSRITTSLLVCSMLNIAICPRIHHSSISLRPGLSFSDITFLSSALHSALHLSYLHCGPYFLSIALHPLSIVSHDCSQRNSLTTWHLFPGQFPLQRIYMQATDGRDEPTARSRLNHQHSACSGALSLQDTPPKRAACPNVPAPRSWASSSFLKRI